jgi:hypothetical protein
MYLQERNCMKWIGGRGPDVETGQVAEELEDREKLTPPLVIEVEPIANHSAV